MRVDSAGAVSAGILMALVMREHIQLQEDNLVEKGVNSESSWTLALS